MRCGLDEIGQFVACLLQRAGRRGVQPCGILPQAWRYAAQMAIRRSRSSTAGLFRNSLRRQRSAGGFRSFCTPSRVVSPSGQASTAARRGSSGRRRAVAVGLLVGNAARAATFGDGSHSSSAFKY